MEDLPESPFTNTGQFPGSHVSETEVESQYHEDQSSHGSGVDTQEVDALCETQAMDVHEESTQSDDTAIPDAQGTESQQPMTDDEHLGRLTHQPANHEEGSKSSQISWPMFSRQISRRKKLKNENHVMTVT